jgi:hypothetical protein
MFRECQTHSGLYCAEVQEGRLFRDLAISSFLKFVPGFQARSSSAGRRMPENSEHLLRGACAARSLPAVIAARGENDLESSAVADGTCYRISHKFSVVGKRHTGEVIFWAYTSMVFRSTVLKANVPK